MGFDTFPQTQEQSPNLKQQTLDAYKKLKEEKKVEHPDGFDRSDPEVEKAEKLYLNWIKEVDAAAKGDLIKEAEANFEKSLFYVEAGFTDPDYLTEVLDWLSQDLENIEDKTEPAFVDLAKRMKAKMEELEQLLPEDRQIKKDEA